MTSCGKVCAAAVLAAMVVSPTAAPARSATADVLAAARSAMGRMSIAGALVANGAIRSSGDLGSWSQTVDMRSGRFATRSSFRFYSVSSGYDGRTLWKQERSGTSLRLDAPFSRADALTQTWLQRRGYLQGESARFSYVGRGQVGSHSVVTLMAVPRGGNPVRLAFDETSHLLLQVTRESPYSTVAETYSDYRRVGKAVMPFRIESGAGPATAISVATYRLLSRNAAGFGPPPRPRDTRTSAVRAVALDGRSFPTITASVDGEPFDFIVDTGGHNILTPAAAAKLGLALEGQGSSGGAGTATVVQRDTRVRELQVGGVTMSDQHFYVIDLGAAVARRDKPPLGGILGLEVLQRVVVTFDVPRGTLTAAPFGAAPCQGDRIPIMFDDDIPVVRGTVDGVPGQIGIDTGNGGLPVILWRWANANGVAGRFLHGQGAQGSGLGGTSPLVRSQHHQIVVGRTIVPDTEVAYSQDRAGAFSSQITAANIGHSLLARHSVTFDYSRGIMCVGPESGTSPSAGSGS